MHLSRSLWMPLFRGVWVFTAVLVLLELLLGVKVEYQSYLISPCRNGLDVGCPMSLKWFAELGFPLALHAGLQALAIVVAAVPWIGMAFVLFRFKSEHPGGLLLSLMLLTGWLGDVINIPVRLAVEAAYPAPLVHHYVAFLAMGGVILLGLTFPSGRFFPKWAAFAGVGWLVLCFFNQFFRESPLAYENWSAFFNILINLGVPLLPLIALTQRYRTGDPTERDQIRTILPSGIGMGVAFIVFNQLARVVLPALGIPNDSPTATVLHTVQNLTQSMLAGWFGISVSLAVFRDRLFGIPWSLNRTFVYTLLTLWLVMLHTLMVLILGAVLSLQTPLLYYLVTSVVVALLVQPLRDQIQRWINRSLYGERDDPYAILNRLKPSGTPENTANLRMSTLKSIQDSLGLPSIRLQGNQMLSLGEEPMPYPPFSVKLEFQDQHLGQVDFSPRSPEGFSGQEKTLLEVLSRQLSVLEYALRQGAALQQSREQLVLAREEERRRLRADLHDGIAPTLAGLYQRLDTLMDTSDPQEQHQMLEGIQQHLKRCIADLRRMVYRLRPPALDELGMVGALKEHLLGMPIHADLHAENLPPLPAAVEVATYRIALEALNNVVKHAGASQVTIFLQTSGAMLSLQVQDNGHGLPADLQMGIGLRSMQERAEELGGTLLLQNHTDGLTVQVNLPLGEHHD